MKKVLVTGGSGFLGKHICLKLKEQGYLVTSLARNPSTFLEKQGIETVCGDITNHQDMEEKLKGFHSVIHCAAKAGIWGKKADFFNLIDWTHPRIHRNLHLTKEK